MFSRTIGFLGLIMMSSATFATPVDDYRSAVDLAFRELASPYVVSGAITTTGTTDDGDWELLTKPAGSLTATADLYSLAHELNIHATATMAGTATSATTIKFDLTCPGAIGQTVNVTIDTTTVSVKITAITGQLNTVLSNVVPVVDPTAAVGRNVSLVPDTTKSNFLKMNGLLGGLLPVQIMISPAAYSGLGGSANLISGTVTLEALTAATLGQPVSITILTPGGTVVDTRQATLGPDGAYAIATTASGTHQIVAKSALWLSAKRSSVNVSTSTAASFSLLGGDCDGDDVVSLFDYLILSAAFDATPTDASWDARADLDGDLVVSLFDYLILSANFDIQGPTEN